MTLLFLGLCLLFGFYAFRHFSNGRQIWGSIAAFGCLLMAGAVWVDFQRAGDEAERLAPSPSQPSEKQPVIGDYKPPATDTPR